MILSQRKRKIGQKVSGLLFVMMTATMLLAGGVSIYSLYSMKQISAESSSRLGQTAAEDAEAALEQMAAEHLQDMAVERAAYIEEKFSAVEAYVLGIAALAEDIYEDMDSYPDRDVPLPVPDSTELAAQLLWSDRLNAWQAPARDELLKLGNIQDMLVQYNEQNDMVSSTYLATESGWMIQADYIAYSKYEDAGTGEEMPLPYEAAQRQWYQRAQNVPDGEVVYTDVICDIHEGGDCIVCASPVYYGGRVVAVAGVGSYLETVNNAVLNTTIGSEGYAFLVNEKGQITVSPKSEGETAVRAEEDKDLRESTNRGFAEAAERMVSGESGFVKLVLDGREVYLAFAPLPRLGWSFVTVMDSGEVIAPARESQERILTLMGRVGTQQNEAIRRMFLLLAALFAAIALTVLGFGTIFSKKVTEPIRTLTKAVAETDGSSLDRRIHIRTGDEVEELGKAFNHMAGQLQDYIRNLAAVTAEKERIRTEIQVASRLQADMLPEAEGAFADREEFSLYATMTPAKGVGGDFYDFFQLDEDHLALVMADVSGKGVPAALFMVVSRTLIRSHIMSGVPLAQAVQEINENLCRNNKNGMFVTAWLGILAISTGELQYVNAGHCRPLILHGDGSCEYENSRSGFVLAGMKKSIYRQSELQLRQGDTLLLYTDGVTEATSVYSRLYGEERLKECVSRMEHMGSMEPRELLLDIWKDVEDFQGGAEQFDDITMLAVTYKGRAYKEKKSRPDMKDMWQYADFVEEALTERGVSSKTAMDLQIALDEILSNICYYSEAAEVSLRVQVTEGQVELIFEDDGIPYNPLERPDPDVGQPLSERKAGGLGIYLVKKRMDRVTYEYVDGKNRLTLVKQNNMT